MSDPKAKTKIPTREPKPKKFNLSIPPALRLPHQDLIRPEMPTSSVINEISAIPTPSILSPTPILKDQVDLHIDQPIIEKPSEITLDNLATVDNLSNSPQPMATVDKMTRVDNLAKVDKTSTLDKMTRVDNLTEVVGETKIPNSILDRLLSVLDPTASLVYLRLYRLSYGYRKTTCIVGLEKLATSINSSQRSVQRAVERLEQMGLIERQGSSFGGKIKGNCYQVNLPSTLAKMATLDKMTKVDNLAKVDNLSTVAILADIKDHDHDDLKEKDHHQREVMMIYSSITGNAWSKADDGAYQKIKDYPIEIIKATIRIVTERAAQSPGSLHYFVAEILKAANPTPATKAQQKAAIKQIIKEVRETYTGTNLKPSEFAEAVKERCAREGVVFDGRMFNDLMS